MNNHSSTIHFNDTVLHPEALCCAVQYMYYEFLIRLLRNYPKLSAPVNTFILVSSSSYSNHVTVHIHSCTEYEDCRKDNLICNLLFCCVHDTWEYLASDGFLQVLEYAEDHAI